MLEMLRQPLEDITIAISRSAGSLTYPTNFTLIASMNPFPCGYFGDALKECTCSIAMGKVYQKKISGPLIDRSAKPPPWGLIFTSKSPMSPLKSSEASPYGRRTQRQGPGTD
jgi:hypothetical protein